MEILHIQWADGRVAAEMRVCRDKEIAIPAEIPVVDLLPAEQW